MQQLFKVIDTRDNSDVTEKIGYWYIDPYGELSIRDYTFEELLYPRPDYKVQFNKDALTAILAKLEG